MDILEMKTRWLFHIQQHKISERAPLHFFDLVSNAQTEMSSETAQALQQEAHLQEAMSQRLDAWIRLTQHVEA